ncbi:MAG: restriction endonuclease subunit R [Flavobacteriales bacterium]|nr:restriction endonuclease subunit R [Flavobacteriales bacterium]|tara:strand:+ start:3781 stop:4200 length:420 start_codon:yes stop_codon:yes gene_type:complete
MKIKIENGKEYIFDVVRKKYVIKNPEEWVRQNIINYLNNVKKYPLALMSIEKKNEINNIKKRCDIICNDVNGNPILLIECKASKIQLNSTAFEQTMTYQKKINAKYVLITNGIKHYCFKIEKGKNVFLKKIPSYMEIVN